MIHHGELTRIRPMLALTGFGLCRSAPAAPFLLSRTWENYNSITSTSRFDKPFGLELIAERLKALRALEGHEDEGGKAPSRQQSFVVFLRGGAFLVIGWDESGETSFLHLRELSFFQGSKDGRARVFRMLHQSFEKLLAQSKIGHLHDEIEVLLG